jgi:inorganic pyrophosphatase
MMSDTFIQKTQRLEIDKYKEPKDRLSISRTYVPYSGSLQKHPDDAQKVILITDPYSTNISYFEFNQKDIKYLERLPAITNLKGETANMTRIWVKKNSLAVRCTPFIVNNTE